MTALGVTSRAHAFNNTSDYGKSPMGGNVDQLGGGAGRYFTGSPADGYSCENCHSAPAVYSFPIQLTGLPQDGYVPGQQYKIEISSPIANAQLAQALANGKTPAASLTAEFVAEDGGPAGTIEFVNESDRMPERFADQYCSTLAMAAADKRADEYGLILYQADTGAQAREITLSESINEPEKYPPCTVEHGMSAEGVEYNRRCVVTMKNCGTKTVKFLWTAPEKWSSPIWFSMGYVATYNLSGEPNDEDYVTTMTIPLNPSYKGPTFETDLSSGCSVVNGPQRGAGGRGSLMLLGLSLGGMVIARSRKRRRLAALPLWAASLVILVLAGLGCSDGGKGLVTDVPASIGVYDSIGCVRECTPPLDCRKAAWPDAGTPETVAEGQKLAKMMMRNGATAATATAGALDPLAGAAAAGTGEPGAAAPTGKAKSLGTVTAVLSSAQPAGVVSTYSVKCGGCDPNYVAYWIVNDKGEYVRMLHTQGGTYVPATMPNFTKLGSDCQTPKEEIDATAMATKLAHEQYTLTWDGLYGNGHIAAPPGLYHIKFEVAIDEQHPIPLGDIPFMFGDPAPYTVMIEPEPSHTAGNLTYTPNP